MSIDELNRLKAQGEAPPWMQYEGFMMLQGGYLLSGETPKGMYTRLAKAASARYNKPEWFQPFFDLFWNGWLCAASPVASNMGTDRGLPISCYGVYVPDSIAGIGHSIAEMKCLSKNGGGLGFYMGDIRGRGMPIGWDEVLKVATNGFSEGVIPFAKEIDVTTHSTSQGSTRRGASAVYIDIEHPDVKEWIKIRKPNPDSYRECPSLHHGVCISDKFMERVYAGEPEAQELWLDLLDVRMQTGEPYISFTDNANKNLPASYVINNLRVRAPQLCTEIFLHNDEDHTYVCCLSSLNALRMDEIIASGWAVKYSIYFLDAVMEEFIDKIRRKMEEEPQYAYQWRRVLNFAEKSRAIGLGVLGWHSLLKSKGLPFDSFQSMMLNSKLFSHMKEEADIASRELAEMFGEPEWCKGLGERNTHKIAVAPTRSNSLIAGLTGGKGIEPDSSVTFVENAAKGSFDMRCPYFTAVLEKYDKNTPEVWSSIVGKQGSVQHLDFLSDEEKEVFLTAFEINQFAVVKQAAQRQKFIDQGQSVNLFFPSNADPVYINQVTMAAHLSGLKSLYYCKTQSVIQGDVGSSEFKREYIECASCEG